MIDIITLYIVNLIGNPTVITGWWLVLVTVFSIVFESWWRRWFGTSKMFPKWLDLLNKRFIKHIVNCIFLFCMCYFVRGLVWQVSTYFMLVFLLLFWTPTFGMYFDIGRGGKPVTEYDISEYNKSWFASILNWFFTEDCRYTAFYDYIGMFIRFTAPLFLLFWLPTFNSGLLFLGTIAAISYGLGWTMLDKKLLKKIGPTSFGEYVTGAAAGLYIALSV